MKERHRRRTERERKQTHTAIKTEKKKKTWSDEVEWKLGLCLLGELVNAVTVGGLLRSFVAETNRTC